MTSFWRQILVVAVEIWTLSARLTSSGEEDFLRFVVKIHEVEDNALVDESEALIVHLNALASIDDLNPWQSVLVLERLKVWNSHVESLQVKGCCFFSVHVVEVWM